MVNGARCTKKGTLESEAPVTLGTRMNRLPTLELAQFPRRAGLMAAAASVALAIDFVSKEIAVALNPDTLLFNWVDALFNSPSAGMIFIAAACSLLACVLPARAVVLGAGAAFGGAMGNLTSRARWWDTHGGTPDFIRFGDGSTGNVADIFIAVGLALMLLGVLAWLGRRLLDERARPSTGTSR